MAAALALLALVAGQDVEPAEGFRRHRWPVAHRPQGRPRPGDIHGGPGRRGTPASRREARRDGYRAHVAAEPETGIITDEALTKAAGTENSDRGVAEKFRGRRRGGRCDGGRPGRRPVSGTAIPLTAQGILRAAIDDIGHDAVIKPKPLTAPVEGGFTVDDFTIDEQAGTVGCPAGNTRPLEPDPGSQLWCAVPRLSSALRGAPLPRPAAKSFCTNEMTCFALPVVTGLPTLNYGRSTARTGPTWNGSSPRSPAAAAAAA